MSRTTESNNTSWPRQHAVRLLDPTQLPDKPALIGPDQTLTFADLHRRSQQWANAWQTLGIGAGSRIAVLAPPSAEQVVAMLGAYRCGATWVPINPRYRRKEVEHVVADSGATTLLVSPDRTTEVADLAPRTEILSTEREDSPMLTRVDQSPATPLAHQPGDPDIALLIYTSGTTGRSKGVALSFGAIVENIAALTGAWRWSGTDVLCLMLPLFHVHGLCIGIHGALLHGMTVRLHARFAAAAVVDDVTAGATIFMGVPTMYARLLEHLDKLPQAAEALGKARLFTSGSAALQPAHFQAFEDHTGHRILERYGMSETLITLTNPYEGPRLAGAVGGPVPGVEIRVVDDDNVDIEDDTPGELWVKSNGIMSGYYGQPQATAQAFTDGWFRTGDVVTRDRAGVVRIVGRKSVDIIKSGGFKIGAREIENVLARHAAVADVAVVGAPDSTWGESIVAFVVLRDRSLTDNELLSSLQSHVTAALADYKKPRRVIAIETLPRNALGKVQKTILKSWL